MTSRESLIRDGLISETEQKEYQDNQALLEKTLNTITLLKEECEKIRDWIGNKNIEYHNHFIKQLMNKTNNPQV